MPALPVSAAASLDPLSPSVEELCAAWAARVRENREQVDRVREVPDPTDFYGPVSSVFRVDPLRTDEPALELLRDLVRPGEQWLDIGAGAGRYALPIALLAGSVVAVDASPGMLAALREDAGRHGIANVRVVEGRWPLPAGELEAVRSDVALIAHIGYDIDQICPFLAAMEGSARRLSVAILGSTSPTVITDRFWPAVHGQPRAALPALRELLILLLAMGRVPEVRLVERAPRTFATREELVDFARHHTWVKAGGERDRRLVELVGELACEIDGRFGVEREPSRIGVVTWEPAGARDSGPSGP